MRRVAILGATGSIGSQCLDVISRNPDRLSVAAMAARSRADELLELAARHGCSRVALFDEPAAERAGVPGGLAALEEIAASPDVDIVVVAVAGVIGLAPTMAALAAGKHVALASKEVLVAAGETVMARCKEGGARITPIDSEHSAIFQCLQGYSSDQVARLVLTASGGPFRGWTRERLESVTIEQALSHPTWRMGGKITIDSATLMNKGLEVIEARWLFDLPTDRVDVMVHPQSVIHSMVELNDSSVLAQLGWPNMRLPIQYALLYPERVDSGLPRWDPLETGALTFEAVDNSAFPAIRLARDAACAGGTMPCVLNAANEEAVKAFLEGRIGFLAITESVQRIMERHMPQPATLEAVYEADKWARGTFAAELGL